MHREQVRQRCVLCVVNAADQQVTDEEFEVSEHQSDSEAMTGQTCPIECNTSQSVSPVKPSVLSASVPTDVKFNCSSRPAYYESENEAYTDVTSLRRPALFQRPASDIVNSSLERETISDGVESGGSDVDSSDDHVPHSRDAASQHHTVSINDVYSNHTTVVSPVSTAGLSNHRHAGSTDDLCIPSTRDITSAGEEISRDTATAYVTSLSDDNVSNDDDVITSQSEDISRDMVTVDVTSLSDNNVSSHADVVRVVTGQSDVVNADGEVSTVSDERISTAADVHCTTSVTDLLQPDEPVNDGEDQLPSSHRDVHDQGLIPDMILQPNVGEHTDEATVNMSRVSVEPAADEDLAAEVMDVESESDVMIASQASLQADTATDVAVTTVTVEQLVEADERQTVMDRAESGASDTDANIQRSPSTSPRRSMSRLCFSLTIHCY